MAQLTNAERDNITTIIGNNLLKGYRLMEEACQRCNTPLMCPRGGDPFCVFCEVKQEAAVVAMSMDEQVPAQSNGKISQTNLSESLQQKLAWAVDLLNKTADIDQSLKLAQLIKTLLETLKQQ